jgi:hypothetical protein
MAHLEKHKIIPYLVFYRVKKNHESTILYSECNMEPIEEVKGDDSSILLMESANLDKTDKGKYLSYIGNAFDKPKQGTHMTNSKQIEEEEDCQFVIENKFMEEDEEIEYKRSRSCLQSSTVASTLEHEVFSGLNTTSKKHKYKEKADPKINKTQLNKRKQLK